MRDLIDAIAEGDDTNFEKMVVALADSTVFLFAKSEDEEALTFDFLTFILEDDESIEYIPLFSDEKELEDFLADEDVPEGYEVFEIEGAQLAEMIEEEQYLMINPVSGGIVFEGAHLQQALDEK